MAVVVGTACAAVTGAVVAWSVVARWRVVRDARGRVGAHGAPGHSSWVPSSLTTWLDRHRSLPLAMPVMTMVRRLRGVSGVHGDAQVGGDAQIGGHPTGASGDDPTADMVQVLDGVARSIRGGAGVHQALRSVAPMAGVHAGDLAGVVGQLDGGVTLMESLSAWRQRRPTPVVSLATAVLTFGVDTGGSLARAVDGAAATLRERLALQGEVRVLAAQARASAMVVGAAPVGFTVVVAIADRRVAAFLLTTAAGWVCLVVGAGLEMACVAWMRSLVSRAGVL